jgi:hypothetical protein
MEGAIEAKHQVEKSSVGGEENQLLHGLLIDRTVARYTEIAKKDFYFIVTAADSNKAALERTIDGFRAFTSCLTGSKEKGIVYGTGAWEIGDILKSRAMKQAYEMGKALS